MNVIEGLRRIGIGTALGGFLLVFAACAADPYNVFPDASRVERIVLGDASLQVQPPRPYADEYVLFEGIPMEEGGMVWKPFYLSQRTVTPRLGSAIQNRKGRYTEVFGLLSRGTVGEAASNRLVPRVGSSELTRRELQVIDEENRDREVIVEFVVRGQGIPMADADAVRRVFAFARAQRLPSGIWFENERGQWLVKGGRDYRSRVMAREPLELPPPQAADLAPAPTPVEPELQIDAPRPRVRR